MRLNTIDFLPTELAGEDLTQISTSTAARCCPLGRQVTCCAVLLFVKVFVSCSKLNLNPEVDS
eukprot:m.24232 g.24232  ORF g.24232 m.24232 type:complete len:63 (-) comp6045_c0_seq1:1131-1319(-)